VVGVLLRKNCPVVVLVICPVADKVVNAPVDGVVVPMAVEFRPVEVKVPTAAVPPVNFRMFKVVRKSK
jgi:hypothetical protein